MKRSALALSCILLAAAAVAAPAQVVPSADANKLSITVGAMGSIFQPDFAGQWKFSCTSACSTAPVGLYYPVAQSSDQPLFGPGAYVDIKFRRWVQLEAEGRWLRYNRFQDIHQDNYLIGPKVPVYHFLGSTVYGKALVGFSRMDLGYGYHGNFTTVAFGGGLDVKLTKHISIRAFDGEYQYWPSWGNSKLLPYGASAGIGYKIF
jgi:hypothetical protein